MNEPSVLDYVKALLTPWKGKPPAIPPLEGPMEGARPGSLQDQMIHPVSVETPARVKETIKVQLKLPWRIGIGLLAALFAQILLASSKQQARIAVPLFIIAIIFLVLAAIEREWVIGEIKEDPAAPMPLSIRQIPILIAIPLVLLAFIAFGDKETRSNLFTGFNLIIWLASLIAIVTALYLPDRSQPGLIVRTVELIKQKSYNLKLSRFSFVFIGAIGLVAFFRFFRLGQVPLEMFSDQAEKLLDVMDVLLGKTSVFFIRNTGREAFQIYLTALISMVFGTKISFLSLKIGTALAGFLSLPYIYLLGKQVGGRTVGLMAFTLAGIAYWPNVISRVGLRFPLYPLFAAPALFYLIRGLRYRRRNDFIWSGIALGIGLHGYSPVRFLPIVVVLVVAIYLLHRHSRGSRGQSIWGVLGLAAVSLVVFIPLLRFAIENPDMFSFRMLTRMGTLERAYPGSVGLIFLGNLWKSLVMFFYDNGNVWVNSIPGRPALDTITAVLFIVGCVLLAIRYIRQRHWLDLTILLLVPLLMMTSILSLAFPDENPSLNRSAAAIIPVFIIAGFGFDAIVKSFLNRVNSGGAKVLVGLFATGLLGISVFSNYQLVFDQYSQQYNRNAWNTSQIGQVIRDFSGSQGNLDTAYVIPYPYWVDTRLIGMQAGYPTKDYALQPDQIETTSTETRAKLFIFNTADLQTTENLESLYPTGTLYRYSTGSEVKDFMMYFVPPNQP